MALTRVPAFVQTVEALEEGITEAEVEPSVLSGIAALRR